MHLGLWLGSTPLNEIKRSGKWVLVGVLSMHYRDYDRMDYAVRISKNNFYQVLYKFRLK